MVKFEKVKGKDFGDIKIYTLSTCGWCRKTKNFLNDHQAAYSYIDVDLLPEEDMDEAVKEQKAYNPRVSYPTVVVNGTRTIIGFDEEQLKMLCKGE